MRFNRNIVIFLLLSFFLEGCFSVPDYPNVPQIEFEDIKTVVRIDQQLASYKDSITVSIKFKDGDGDLGVIQEKVDESVPYNFEVKQYRKNKGIFEPYTSGETLSGHFHQLSTGKPGPLEGVIHYRIEIFHPFYEYARDTVKFEVAIRDRAGNRSNTVETTPIVIKTL